MKHRLFDVPVYEFDLNTRDIELIHQEIKPVIDKLDNLNRPWPENVFSTFQFEKNNNVINDFDLIFCKDKILEHASAFIENSLESIRLSIESSWINILPPAGFQYAHHHPFSFISGVYYISANTDSGNLIFENPNQILDFVDPINSVFGENSFCIQPKTGKLVLFPSWLKHRVSINESEFDRIAMPFNLVRDN